MTAALLVAMYATSYLQGMQRFLAYNLVRTVRDPDLRRWRWSCW